MDAICENSSSMSLAKSSTMIIAWPPTSLMRLESTSVFTVVLIEPTSSIWLASTPTTLETRSTTNPSGWPTSTTSARVESSCGNSGKPNSRRSEMMGKTFPRRFARPSNAAGASGTLTTSGTRMISFTGTISAAKTSSPAMKVTNCCVPCCVLVAWGSPSSIWFSSTAASIRLHFGDALVEDVFLEKRRPTRAL